MYSTTVTSSIPQATDAVCPGFNNQLYNANGTIYTILCNTYLGGDAFSNYYSSDGADPYLPVYDDIINGLAINDMESCINACAFVKNCDTVDWLVDEQVCVYVQTTPGMIIEPAGSFGVNAAVLYKAPPPTSIAICPALDNSLYTDWAGYQYTIFCGTSFAGNSIGQVPNGTLINNVLVVDLLSCLETCNDVSTCVGVVWDQTGVCTYQSDNRVGPATNSATDSAMLSYSNVQCDSWNNKAWIDLSGNRYEILCNATFEFNAGYTCNAVGDMIGPIAINSFADCIDSCQYVDGCVGVDWSSDNIQQTLECCYSSSPAEMQISHGMTAHSSASLSTTRADIDCSVDASPADYTNMDRSRWRVYCDIDFEYADLPQGESTAWQGDLVGDILIVDLQSCINACPQVDGCLAVTWNIAGFCIWKTGFGRNSSSPVAWSAAPIDLG
jgi:hypothetical protein